MTTFESDILYIPAARTVSYILTAVSAVSLMGLGTFASAQSAVPISASAHQAATQAPQTSPPQTAVDDKYKPRIYGGPQQIVTNPKPVVNPAPALKTQPPASVNLPTSAPAKAQRQVNIIANENSETPLVNGGSIEISKNINPHLPPNSELNSAPNWTNGIRAQFIAVIAGVPIIKDPTTCSDGNPGVNIKAVNVKKTEGVIVADLHNDVKENFLVWDEVLLRVRAAAKDDETTFCMPVPKAGDYSIAIYHDKNSNAVFDKNFLGLPKERFGMSNNPKFSTKSPEFEEATFTVPESGLDMLIKLRTSGDVISGNQD